MYWRVILLILCFTVFLTGNTVCAADMIPSDITLQHPRLLVTDNSFAEVKAKITSDNNAQRWYGRLKADAHKMLTEAPVVYDLPDGVRLLSISRKVLLRVQTLALVYKVEGDKKYLDRLWLELKSAAAFPDWHPAHFLDTAEMTNAFAIGYDWLYQDWNDEQKGIIRNAIMEKGLNPALALYRGQSKGSWWANTQNNWNLVCNSGISMGALALADEFPAVSKELLTYAVKGMPTALASYEPEGAWYEGVSYWEYATSYITYFLASAKTALHTDFTFLQGEGFKQNPYFPIYLTGQGKNSFNFSDATAGRASSPAMFWLGKHLNHPEIAGWRRDELNWGARPQALDLLWYDPGICRSMQEVNMPLDKYYRKVEVVTMRNAWNDPAGIFVGFKGFDTTDRNHTDLDSGTFVLEADGVLWAEDFGADNYNLPGYFSMKDGQRWQYYRKRAEGHNTVVINPSQEPDQNPAANARMLAFHTNEEGAAAKLDLTLVYQQSVISASREVSLFDKRRQVSVNDDIILKQPGDIWWFVHTRAKITISEDGQTAILEKQGKKMKVSLVSSNKNLRFQVMEAKPLLTSPNPPGQNTNTGFSKLAIHASECKELYLTVLFKPYIE